MDPITVVGVVSASLQIAQFIGSTIQGLNTLKGKFKDADTTIRLLMGQLSTIKAAVFQIRDWADYSFDDSPKDARFLDGLNVALDGCQAAMDVLSEEVKDLMAGFESPTEAPVSIGMRLRIKAVWSEENMKAHQDRLYGQVQALQLLLMAGQCRDAASQSILLGLKENQKLIQKVADDTKTLRESHSSVASQATQSVRNSITGGTTIGFDRGLAGTQPYRNAATRRKPVANSTLVSTIAHNQVKSTSLRNDEGYETATPQPESQTPEMSRNPSTSSTGDAAPASSHLNIVPDADARAPHRSMSIAPSTASDPAVYRWLSSSSSDSPPLGEKSHETGKRKPWHSRLARLNTFGAARLKSPAQRTISAGAAFASEQRLKRRQAMIVNNSIDISSPDGHPIPSIVIAAQAGNRVEIERLLEGGENIEGFHIPTKRTALSVASHCGMVDVVQVLIKRKAKLDTPDVDLSTPLHLASSGGHYNVMLLLLNENVDIEATDKNKQTPLWVAADHGHTRAVEVLLKSGAKINARANDQLSALHAAAKQGDKEMVELLLRHNSHIEARDSNSMTALHHACEAGHYVVAEFLLLRGANIEALGKDSMSPLLCAAASGHVHIVELLLKKKASITSLDEKKANALHWAAKNGHLEVAECLMAWKMWVHGTDVNGMTPLNLAIFGSHFAVVDFLLQKKASVKTVCNEGRTALHYACSYPNADIVRLLLSAKAHPEVQVPEDGSRPIHIAAASGSVEIIKILHQKGVSMAARDASGNRPLCIACRHGHPAVVETLLEFGEPLRMTFKNRQNSDSPLCIAARGGHIEVVRLLIKKGASVKQRDEYGYIPLRYAAFFGHPEVLQLLLEEGAELMDDGEDSNGWGFYLSPDTIGFSTNSNISDERKQLVRYLLDEEEGKVLDSNYRSLEQSRRGARHGLGRAMDRHELAGGLSRARVELSGGPLRPASHAPPMDDTTLPSYAEHSSNPAPPDSKSHFVPPPHTPRSPPQAILRPINGSRYHLPQRYGTTQARDYLAPATTTSAMSRDLVSAYGTPFPVSSIGSAHPVSSLSINDTPAFGNSKGGSAHPVSSLSISDIPALGTSKGGSEHVEHSARGSDMHVHSASDDFFADIYENDRIHEMP